MKFFKNKNTLSLVISCTAIGLSLILALGLLAYFSKGFKDWGRNNVSTSAAVCDCGSKPVCDCDCESGECNCACETCNPPAPVPQYGEFIIWFYNARGWSEIGIYSWDDALLGDVYQNEDNKLSQFSGKWCYFILPIGASLQSTLLIFNWNNPDHDRVEVSIDFAMYVSHQVYINGADGQKYANKSVVPII